MKATNPDSIKEEILSAFRCKEKQVFLLQEVIDPILQKYPDTNNTNILPADVTTVSTTASSLPLKSGAPWCLSTWLMDCTGTWVKIIFIPPQSSG